MSLTSFTAENFRALDLADKPLGRITVLCGANSVGKSSIMKSLLLFKQIDSEGDIAHMVIPLKGSIVDLGDYNSLVKDHRADTDITIGFSAEIQKDNPLKSSVISLSDGNEIEYKLTLSFGKESRLLIKELNAAVNHTGKCEDERYSVARVSIVYDPNTATKIPYKASGSFYRKFPPKLQNRSDVERLRNYEPIGFSPEENELYSQFWTAYDENGKNDECWNNWCANNKTAVLTHSELWLKKLTETFSNNLRIGAGFFSTEDQRTDAEATFRRNPFPDGLKTQGKCTFGGVNAELIDAFLEAIQDDYSIRDIMGNVQYIGPLREQPRRCRIYDDTAGLAVGIRGENAPYVLEKRGKKRINRPWRIDDNGKFYPYTEEKYTELIDEVNEWMRGDTMDKNGRLGCGIVKCEEVSEKTPGIVSVMLNHDGVTSNMSDVGFGVGQIFPIIVEGLFMDNDETLFVEQPEVHLHPKMQGDLADFFIAQALSGKQFIIETHSDHIINRLVRRVVEDGINPDGSEDQVQGIKDLIRIYFAEKKNGEVELNEITISEARGLINWPDGFFDQSLNDNDEIMRAAATRLRRKRQEARK